MYIPAIMAFSFILLLDVFTGESPLYEKNRIKKTQNFV